MVNRSRRVVGYRLYEGEGRVHRVSGLSNANSQSPSSGSTRHSDGSSAGRLWSGMEIQAPICSCCSTESLTVEVDCEPVTALGLGVILGELALLEDGRRIDTVRAVTRCVLR